MALGDAATWVATVIAFITGVAGFVLGLMGYRQGKRANKVAARTAARDEEDWFVDWDVEWDESLCTIRFRNKGSHDALETVVTISAKDIRKVHQLRDVTAGQRFEVPMKEVFMQRNRHAAEQKAKVASLAESSIAAWPTVYSTTLKVTVRWKTGLGFPARHETELIAK